MGEELGSSVLLWYYIAKILGVCTATDGKTACNMLADLIDPGELKTTCIAEVKIEGEKLDEVVNRAIAEYTGIDRDALLELADGLDKDADNIISAARNAQFTGGGPRMGAAKHDAYEWRCIARRIREACGEGER